jgi:hypothetical protein
MPGRDPYTVGRPWVKKWCTFHQTGCDHDLLNAKTANEQSYRKKDLRLS